MFDQEQKAVNVSGMNTKQLEEHLTTNQMSSGQWEDWVYKTFREAESEVKTGRGSAVWDNLS